MAVLSDLSVAAIAAVVVFLGSLGVLVIFVESVKGHRLVAFVAVDAVIAAAFLIAGDVGMAVVALAVAAAALTNEAFERFTLR